MRNRVLFLALIAEALLFEAAAAPAATITVNSAADSGGSCPGASCTLRQAIASATSGDTVNFAAGITTIDLTSGELLIDKNLMINGPGPNVLTVQRSAAARFRIFHIVSASITVTISGLKIADGSVASSPNPESGGGISNAGTLTISTCTISGNKADYFTFDAYGGGIYNTGLLTINNSIISGNTGDHGAGGGGLANFGRLTINNSSISGNSANSGYTGGGIYNRGPLTIINSTLSANGGGGMNNGAPGVVTISNGIISANIGGGISNGNGGTVDVMNSTISTNSAGGGVRNFGTVTIANSTISANSSGDYGGGIYNYVNCTVTVTNSTISGNSVTFYGGGIYNYNDANGNVGIVRARNSIIALNTFVSGSSSGPDVYGPLTSQNFNLIGNNADATITPAQPADQIGTPGSPIDPLLGPLQNNGGPTFTHALQSGSPAIDQGHSNGSTADQRGFTRPVDLSSVPNAIGGDGSDIGAFEFEGMPAVVLGNISTRLRVETGENVLIGGFIVTGTQPKRVIVRAIGPSLPVAGALADPVLELRDSSGGLIRSNDNWRSDQEAEIIATTIPPSNDLESAIVRNLTPGNYTAIVLGAGGTTGVAVVEAYNLN